jgi:hypothetical protein
MKRGAAWLAAMLLWSSAVHAQTVTWASGFRCDDAVRAPPGARPAGGTDHDALVLQGIAFRKRGQDEEALCDFRRAYALQPEPRVLAQIGLAEEALSQWAAADRDIGQASRSDDPWIAKNGSVLADALQAIGDHLATVVVRTNTVDAELRVNGVLAESVPLGSPQKVASGEVDLEIAAPNHANVVRHLSLPPRSTFEETIEFPPLPPAPSPPRAFQSLPFTTTSVGVPARPLNEERTLAWTLAGTGAAFALAGLAAQLVANADASIYDDDSRCLVGNLTRDERCGVWRDRTETGRALAIAGYAVGGSAILGAAILFRISMPGQTVHSAWSCGPSGGGLACTGTF